MATALRYRLTPWGLAAFARCTLAQRRAFHRTWRDATRIAWLYGPIR